MNVPYSFSAYFKRLGFYSALTLAFYHSASAATNHNPVPPSGNAVNATVSLSNPTAEILTGGNIKASVTVDVTGEAQALTTQSLSLVVKSGSYTSLPQTVSAAGTFDFTVDPAANNCECAFTFEITGMTGGSEPPTAPVNAQSSGSGDSTPGISGGGDVSGESKAIPSGEKAGGPETNFSLGSSEKGDASAGRLSFSFTKPTPDMYQPDGLKEVLDSSGATVIRQPGYTGSASVAPVRQVLSAKQLTDVVPISTDRYEIRVYPRSAAGSVGVGGLYEPTGLPIKKTIVENPGAAVIASTSDQPLYIEQRWGKSIKYALPVPANKYQIRLFFSELHQEQAGKSVFNVSAEDVVKLTNFDPYAVSGARYKAVPQDIESVVSDGMLNLKFTAVQGGAHISAIKVTRAAAGTITGTIDSDLYQSERYGNFSYQFALANGDYEVVLLFAETVHSAAAKRVFDVAVEGTVRLDNYDVYSQAGGANKARVETLPVTLTDGQLDLQFTSVTDDARVSAIAIRSVATGSVVAAVNAGGPSVMATDGTAYLADANFTGGIADYAGRVIMAINAGGSAYTATDGTVFWADNYFTGGSVFAGALNRLRITTEEAGDSPKVYDYAWVPNPESGMFDENILTHPSGLKKEGYQQVWSSDGQSYQEIRTIRDAANTLVSKTVATYEKFPFGFRQVSLVTDPDGSALTTIWTYIEGSANPADPRPMGYGLVHTQTNPDGFWQKFIYDDQNRVTKTISRYLNSTSEAENDSKVETVTYATSNPVRTYVATIQGQEVARSYETLTLDSTSNEAERANIICVTPGAAWNADDNLVSKTRTYISAHPTELLRGQIKWTSRPDGTQTLYSYVSAMGTRTVTRDTGVPNSGLTAITDGTRTVTINNPAGQHISETVIDLASGLTLSSWAAATVDDLGRPTEITYGDSTTRALGYAGSAETCGCNPGPGNSLLAFEIDRNGVSTTYVYDDLNRRTETTHLGVTTKVVYDAVGRIVERLRIGSGPAISQQRTVYDLAGRVTYTQDALGNVTDYTYTYPTDGGVVTTATYPAATSGATRGTRIETTYADGRIKEVSGTAVSPLKYVYHTWAATGQAGEWTQEIKIGDASTETEWVKTYSDLAGRTVNMEYPAVSGTVSSTMSYNAFGQLKKETDADGVQTLYVYNNKGERELTVVDMDRDGVIDYEGVLPIFLGDRITKSVRDVYNRSGTIVSRTTTQVWANSANAVTTVSVVEQDGYGNASWHTDASGAVGTSGIARTSPGAWTVTNIQPDGSRQVRTYNLGRLMSSAVLSSTLSSVNSVSYAYDAHNRVETQTDARTGDTDYTYTARDEVLASTTNNGTETTTYSYDALGNQLTITRPDSSVTSNEYHLRNSQLKKTSGSQTYPVEYTYDLHGRRKTLTTWQNITTSAGAAVTTWNYDAKRGWLTQKLYDDNTGPSYTYTDAGRLETRTWMRTVSGAPLVTTYGYNNAGDLISTDYSDTTPDVAISYTRFGAQQTVADATGTRTFTHTTALRPDQEQLPSFYGNRILTRSYQTTGGGQVPGRSDGFELGVTGVLNQDYAVAYSYDASGRLGTVTAHGTAYTYGYLPNSNLRHTITGPVHVATTTYETYRNAIGAVENKVGSTTVSKFDYTVNNLGQRTQRANTGSGFGTSSTDVFTYNAKGEIESATNALLAVRDQSFAYDDIGNRKAFTQNSGTTNYTANSLNAYTLVGAATPAHDQDGNQRITGSGQIYEWDAENRLVLIAPVIPITGDKKQLNTYDALSRRVRKQVSTYTSGSWSLTTDEKFIYDAWNVVAVFDAASSDVLLRTYTWGADLSGSMQGAGGVGGLLAAKDGSSVYHYTYDANGNVSEVLNNSGGIAAHYEYDVFGNTLSSSGPYAATNTYGFSTKPLDRVSGLHYYGLRYYNSSTGRWPSRDPISENGGLNLYAMVANNSLNLYDYLGLSRGCGPCVADVGATPTVESKPAGFINAMARIGGNSSRHTNYKCICSGKACCNPTGKQNCKKILMEKTLRDPGTINSSLKSAIGAGGALGSKNNPVFEAITGGMNEQVENQLTDGMENNDQAAINQFVSECNALTCQ